MNSPDDDPRDDPRDYPTFLNPVTAVLAVVSWVVFLLIITLVGLLLPDRAETEGNNAYHLTMSRYVYPPTAANPNDEAWVELGPPEVSGAVATVTFHNERVHSSLHERMVPLTWENVKVHFRIDYNAFGEQAEMIEVYPMDGLVAVPPSVVVGEYETGKIHLYPAQASG